MNISRSVDSLSRLYSQNAQFDVSKVVQTNLLKKSLDDAKTSTQDLLNSVSASDLLPSGRNFDIKL